MCFSAHERHSAQASKKYPARPQVELPLLQGCWMLRTWGVQTLVQLGWELHSALPFGVSLSSLGKGWQGLDRME